MSDFPSSAPHATGPEPSGNLPEVSPFDITDDPLWLMTDEGFTPTREHELESLFSVSNGYLGARGSIPMGIPHAVSDVFIAGVFETYPPSPIPELVAVPGWTLLSQSFGSSRPAVESLLVTDHRRLLDMRQGMFRRLFRFSDPQGRSTYIRFLRIASLANRHVLLQTLLCIPENYDGPVAIRSGFLQPSGAAGAALPTLGTSRDTPLGPVHVLQGRTHSGVEIALAVATRLSAEPRGAREPRIRRITGKMDDIMELEVESGKTYRIDWIETCFTSRDIEQPADMAVAHLQRLLQEGVEPALRRHADVWNQRWRNANVEIVGDEDAQRAIRFACYHLISAANPEDEHVSISAKALTGPAYKGHVFWDTEIFLLPFYTLTDPPSARALLMYRYHTLAAARDKASKYGYKGALYPWESADTGKDVTPSYAITPMGDVIPVLTGEQSHHISADVAYAVWQYWQATQDAEFLCNAGAEILMETARFWASRVEPGADGLYHIREVIGPDEYHEGIDDNAYTNWMARWNLECAADAVRLLTERYPQQWLQLAQRIRLGASEPQEWLAVAGRIYDSMDAERGLIEQFEDYFQLEELDMAEFTPRSLPIDVILGRERTRKTKVIKQADVVMLLHLLWQRVPASIRERNFRYYEPHTEHGSSLSPAIHALIAARLGDMETALRYFRQAREIDLANNMGNASGGVHIAAIGGLWQAIVFGFAGLSFTDSGLSFLPHCPEQWRTIRFPLLWQGQQLQVEITPSSIAIRLVEGESLPVSVGDAVAVRLEAGQTSKWEMHEGTWKEVGHECQ
jgi:kojibiose phosphorylase